MVVDPADDDHHFEPPIARWHVGCGSERRDVGEDGAGP
eukprot:gene11078-66089_t